jgi:3-methyl-2-oxobutanoate hydroxymethyltransferase
MAESKVTAPDLLDMKERGERITVLTAHDYPTARLLERAGIDVVLVGDSLGNVVLGFQNTLPVTMEHMIYHTKAVAAGLERALLVTDMPYLSYQIAPEQAIENAGRLLKEAGAEAVKIEGGEEMAETVRRLVDVGIPVMGHVGYTPQSVHAIGRHIVRGRDGESAQRVRDGAQALQSAGAFAVVLEAIPADLAREVTESLTIPTIGIGAGVDCSGQVLVLYDMLGLYEDHIPKFVKQYAQLGDDAVAAITRYAEEVKSGGFPGLEHSY